MENKINKYERLFFVHGNVLMAFFAIKESHDENSATPSVPMKIPFHSIFWEIALIFNTEKIGRTLPIHAHVKKVI